MPDAEGSADAPYCLSGLKVIEVAGGVAGAFCGRLLSVLGAEVIKVEPPHRGDVTRSWGPFAADLPEGERSLLFLNLNLNKRGVTLDLKQRQGFELLLTLAQTADVLLLEGEQPQLTTAQIGELQDANPDLVIAVMRPFGLTGAYSGYKAQGFNTFHGAGSGYLIPSGPAYVEHPDRQPLNLPGQTSDEYSGLVASIGILAACEARATVGGQVIDCSMQEAHLSASRQQIVWYANDGLLETRESYHVAFAGCIPCKDGYVELYILSNDDWRGFIRMMGSPAWALHEKFDDVVGGGPGRSHPYAHEIQEGIITWASQFTKREIYKMAQAEGVPLGFFATPAEVARSSHEHARSFFVSAGHEVAGSLPYSLACFKLSGTPPAITRTAPLLGQHNAEVFGSLLGLSSEQLTALSRMGTI